MVAKLLGLNIVEVNASSSNQIFESDLERAIVPAHFPPPFIFP